MILIGIINFDPTSFRRTRLCVKFFFNLQSFCVVSILSFNCHYVFAQKYKNNLEIYGFVMTDAGYNFNTINPDWFDVMRVTKLPAFENEYKPDGKVFFGVRQTRFGVKSNSVTSVGKLKTQFDFDLFGVGKDVGQTTFHLVNAYGQLGDFGAGQTGTAFMDFGVFPAAIDYWGPTSRVFFLNLQIFYAPIQELDQSLKFALERPGGSADGGDYTERIELQSVKPFLNVPNFTAHYKLGSSWGYAQLAGIVKSIKWRDESDTSAVNLSGSAVGWGMNLSTVINLTKNVKLKMQGVTGAGIENYLADAPADIGLEKVTHGASQTVKGKAIPVSGFFVFTEILWSNTFKSSIGYSYEEVSNTNLQSANAFRKGQYGLINLLCYPDENVLAGIEYQFGRRDNFKDGFYSIDNKIQFSFKYSYSNLFELK